MTSAPVASPSADPDPANNSSSVATTVTVSADLTSRLDLVLGEAIVALPLGDVIAHSLE
jgi:hypothetical protein